MITCPSKDQLKQLLNRQVDDTEVVEIESHIQSCEACQKAFQEIKQKFDIIWGQTRSSNEPIANANPIGSASTIGTQNPNPTVEISENVSIPGYEISGLLGSGAMGVVYKARHIQLQREVAIKMILAGEHADQGKRTRFRTEAEAIARLQHSNIIQIHEIGEHQGLPYISLELCEGGTLRSKLDGTPWQPKDAASLVEKLGRAIQVAHQAKVIHRDLKPGNILFGVGGEAKITDFGLAKKLDGEESNSQTQTGAVVGTPSYMAPEQASSERKELSPATDTYALGAILYELLTGRPPFKAATLMDTLWQVLNKDPIPVRQLQPNVPRDLETICLKCLRKDPSKRYPSARDLAEDLQSFLDGQPIKARPVGKLERAAKWVKRNAALAASLAAVFVVLALGAGISTWQAIRATDAEWLAKAEAKRAKKNEDQAWKAEKKARDAKKIALDAEKIAKDAEGKARDAEAKAKDAEKDAKDSEKKARKAKKKAILEAKRANENKIRAEKAEKTTRRRLYSAKMNLGDVAWSRKYSGRLLELLEAQRPLPGQLDRRGFEWYYLWWLSHRGNKFTLRGHRDTVWAVAYSPDGRTLASSSSDGTIRLWDVETGKLQAILTSGSGGAYCLAYSPDGKTLCAGRSNSSVEIWDLATNQVRFTLRGHSRAVTSVVFSEDGNILATGEHYEIQIWDTSSWKELRSFKAKGVGSISLSPDGNTVAFCGFQNVRLGNLKTGKVRSLPGDHHWWIWTVAFSPDGKLVASGARDEATVMIWDVETGEKFRGLHGHTKGVHSVVFSQDGKQLASGSGDGTARVWDLATGEHQSYGHLGPVRSVAFSPDGKGLATAGEDYTVKLWDLNVKHQRLVLPRQKGLVWSVAFSPDNRYLATACNGEKTIRVWDLKSGKERLSLVGHKETNCAVAFSPDGKLLASGGHDRSAKIWDLSTGKEIATLTGHKGHIHALAFSPDGKKLASSGTTNEVMLWDTTSWKRIATHTINKQHSWALSFSPDSKNLGVGTNDGKLRIINVVTGRENNILHSGGFDANGSQVFFSPDGSKLAALSEEVVRIWDLSTGEEIRLIGGSQISAQPHCIAFSSDWKILAVGSSDGSVKLWDVERGEERATLRGHTDEVTTIAFSPDDRMLATGGWSGIVQIWSTASEQDVLAQSYVHDPREGLAWSLVEGGDKVWSNQPKKAAETYRKALKIYKTLATEFPKKSKYRWSMARCYYRLGAVYKKTGNLEERRQAYLQAIAVYQKLSAEFPNKASYLFPLASLYLSLRDYHQAIDVYSKILKLQPEDWTILTSRGKTFTRVREWDNAFDDFSRAIKLNPKADLAWGNRAYIYNRMGLYSQAIADYNNAIELNPTDPYLRYMRGSLYRRLRSRRSALSDFNKAIELDSKYWNAYHMRGHIHEDLGHLRLALKDFNKALKGGQAVYLLIDRGQVLCRLKNFKRALPDLTEAIQSGSQDLKVWVNRCVANSRVGEKEQSKGDLAQIARLAGNDVDNWTKVGDQFLLLGEAKQAVEAYSRIIKMIPNDSRAWSDRGWAYCNLEEWHQALDDLNKALSLNANDPFTWNRRGIVHTRLDQHLEAIKDYTQAIELSSDKIDVFRLNRASAFRELKEWNKALKDLSVVIERTPTYAKAWSYRAFVYFRMENQEKALSDISKAIELDPNGDSFWINRGSLYAEREEWQLAAKDFKRAVDCSPNDIGNYIHLTWVSLAKGDQKTYQKNCAEIFSRFGKRRSPKDSNSLAWIATVSPGSGIDAGKLLSLAQRAHKRDDDNYIYGRTLGIALLRAEKFKLAAKHLEKTIKLRKKDSPASWLLMSLAYHHLGKGKEAKHWLERAESWMDEAKQNSVETPNTLVWSQLSWEERQLLRLWRDEAESLIKAKGKVPKSSK